MMAGSNLLPILKRHFGFGAFRPLQEEIIRSVLNDEDALAVLPTGGGKSLCYQLPAVARPGLTVVISPLIALMKDQVDGLLASGVSATFLNSSLDKAESRSRLLGLHAGKYRLLYVAPERLMLPGVVDDVARWGVKLIAVDEAHCISEWGHDFRPEYRQLSTLRARFPEVPILALTATATGRVRQDILAQLKLRDPRVFLASFNRPNLRYRVQPKSRAFDQVLEYLEGHPSDSGIIYCQSRKTSENLAEKLTNEGIAAKPYHAGLTPKERTTHQELFLRDEARVVCATIAFGMGINKPNVRFVIHYDLPKNIEGYYQETGRAGRDGLPAECLLLFSAGDVVKQKQFILEKSEGERIIAQRQLDEMVHYAECRGCRRAALLAYFGETYPAAACEDCDNCLSPRETYDGTLAAQKLLSCVYRVKQHSGFSVGMGHIIEVLTGADTEKVRRWGHDTLSTYGIGKETGRSEWSAIGRELIRLGLLETEDKFKTLNLTATGLATLKQRDKVELTKPAAAPAAKSGRAGAISCDETLFERLRALRKRLADARGVPSYIVFSDVSLRQMARQYPTNAREFARISGVGGNKLREFGPDFISEISAFLNANPKQAFADELSVFKSHPAKIQGAKCAINDSVAHTLRLFRSGNNLPEIAAFRGLALNTVCDHLVQGAQQGENVDLARLFSAEQSQELKAAFDKAGTARLKDVFELLGGKYDYNVLKLFRATLQV